MNPRLLISFLLFHVATATSWTTQAITASGYIDSPGGIAIADLNYDGANDIVITSSSQTFVLINVGKDNEANTFSFAEPVAIGPSDGAYRSVDIAFLPSHGKVGVLLADGSQAAVFIELRISNCGFWPRLTKCSSKSRVIWTDPKASTGKTARLSMDLGDGQYPAIIAVGDDGVSIYPPNRGTYPDASTTLSSDVRFSSVTDIAVGRIDGNPGFVIGSLQPSPGALTAVYKSEGGVYENLQLHTGTRVEAVDIADINGDQTDDIIVAEDDEEGNIPQNIYTIGNSPLTTKIHQIFKPSTRASAVTSGNLFNTSDLPDAAYGMTNGEILLFENQGHGSLSPLVQKDLVNVPNYCEIFDMAVSELWPCTVSIVVTTDCGSTTESGSYVFTADTCDFLEWLESISSPVVSPAYSPSVPIIPTGVGSPISTMDSFGLDTSSSTELPVPSTSSVTPSRNPTQLPTFSGFPSASPQSDVVSTAHDDISSYPTASPTSENRSPFPGLSLYPSSNPSEMISLLPSQSSSDGKTEIPSMSPNRRPIFNPSTSPSSSPNQSHSVGPSPNPSKHPSPSPSRSPSQNPSTSPSQNPSTNPSQNPSTSPTVIPSTNPTEKPSMVPTTRTSVIPTKLTSTHPTRAKSARPTRTPSTTPTTIPSTSPSESPIELLEVPRPTPSPLSNSDSPNSQTTHLSYGLSSPGPTRPKPSFWMSTSPVIHSGSNLNTLNNDHANIPSNSEWQATHSTVKPELSRTPSTVPPVTSGFQPTQVSLSNSSPESMKPTAQPGGGSYSKVKSTGPISTLRPTGHSPSEYDVQTLFDSSNTAEQGGNGTRLLAKWQVGTIIAGLAFLIISVLVFQLITLYRRKARIEDGSHGRDFISPSTLLSKYGHGNDCSSASDTVENGSWSQADENSLDSDERRRKTLLADDYSVKLKDDNSELSDRIVAFY